MNPTTSSDPAEFDYPSHKYLEIYGRAANFTRHKVCLTYFPERLIPKWAYRFTVLLHLLRHYFLAYELWRRRRYDLIIVREFITVPLLLAFPAVWWFRKRTSFVMAHNVQMAATRTRDRVALSMLYRLGFRFIAIESAAGLEEVGLDADDGRILVLPHGYFDAGPPEPRATTARPLLGIIGQHRPEKSIEPLLNHLHETKQEDEIGADILVGSDNRDILDAAERFGFQIADTTAFEAYFDAIDRVDAVLLSFDRGRYYYRSSGVITDAIFRRKIVICPDFPIFRAQVQVPEKVGVVIGSWDQLSDALKEAIDLVQSSEDAFDCYREYRTPESLALALDQYLDSQSAR